MNYGLPYKGSKNKISAEIVANLPAAELLVDVFAGGCAVSHAALLSGKYSRVIANDVNAKFPQLFKDAISGNLPKGYDRYVSREDFNAVKGREAVAACVWSFGNNCKDYLWNEDTEGAKSIAFRLVMSGSRDERVCLYAEFIKYLRNKRGELELRLESLERMQRLESLRAPAAALEVSGVEYQLLNVPRGAVAYCDPPYKGATGYNAKRFDHAAFWDWCRKTSQTNILAVSEYSAPPDFVPVWEKNKICSLGGGGNNKRTVERLFFHESQAHKWSRNVRQMELFAGYKKA